MAYKRQTSFSPFTSKRSVSTRESKDQLALAKALESQRKQTVKEFAGASSQQIEELGRIDKIARQKDDYEINELARFSKSLNSALQTGSKVLGKQYIEGQKEKGAAAYADDPFDPLAVEQELGELSDHVCKDSHPMLIADDLGDMMVVMINIMTRNNLTMEECLDKAYNDIKNRKGKMIDGIFVKEESPGDHIPRQLGGKKN